MSSSPDDATLNASTGRTVALLSDAAPLLSGRPFDGERAEAASCLIVTSTEMACRWRAGEPEATCRGTLVVMVTTAASAANAVAPIPATASFYLPLL